MLIDLRVVDRKAGAVAGHGAASGDRAARNQLAGVADRNMIRQQIGDRIRNAVGAVARPLKCRSALPGVGSDLPWSGVLTL